MQAVRESYTDIGLMRERGLSWAEISDILAKLGVTARANQPISPVTLRSAFFLVGNEGRGDSVGDGESATAPETLAAVHRAALQAGRAPTGEEAVAAPTMDANDLMFTDGQDTPPVVAEAANATAANATPTDTRPTDMVAASPSPESVPPDAVVETLAETLDDPADQTTPAADRSVETESDGEPIVGATPDTDDALGARAAAEAPSQSLPASAAAADAAAPVPVPEPPTLPAVPPVEPQGARTLMSHDESTNVYWKGDRMLGTIFVLNDRGGVGKTLLSHHLMATAMLEGLQWKVVEYEVNERLARLFGPEMVEHRRITQDFMNMMGSGDGFYEFWDLIGPELQRGGRLYDFGGNISQWFFNWAEVSGFDYYVGDGERLTFMVPVTVDLASLSTGMATLERVANIAPKAKRVLVENGFSGPFSQLEDSQYARRKAEMVEREGLQVISMNPCSAPAWARLTGHRLDHVANMTREDLVKLGMTPPVASRSLIVIHEWLRTMRQALSPYLHDALRQTGSVPGKTR